MIGELPGTMAMGGVMLREADQTCENICNQDELSSGSLFPGLLELGPSFWLLLYRS